MIDKSKRWLWFQRPLFVEIDTIVGRMLRIVNGFARQSPNDFLLDKLLRSKYSDAEIAAPDNNFRVKKTVQKTTILSFNYENGIDIIIE